MRWVGGLGVDADVLVGALHKGVSDDGLDRKWCASGEGLGLGLWNLDGSLGVWVGP